jgi:hypothetical protein
MQAVRERQLERWIDQKTNGRVHRLSVQTDGDHLIVHGQTSTHCARQLVLATVLDAIGSRQVNFNIGVGM